MPSLVRASVLMTEFELVQRLALRTEPKLACRLALGKVGSDRLVEVGAEVGTEDGAVVGV
eukprot:gene4803-6111_t